MTSIKWFWKFSETWEIMLTNMRGNSFFPSLGRLSVYFHYSWWPALEWPLTHWRNFFLILWIPTYGYLTLSLARRGMIVAEWSCTLSGSPSRRMKPTLSPNLTLFILPPSSLHLYQKKKKSIKRFLTTHIVSVSLAIFQMQYWWRFTLS